MRFKHTPDGVAVLCGACSRPYAYLTKTGVRVVSQHGNRGHGNVLTPDELEKLAGIARAVMTGIDLRPQEVLIDAGS